LLVALAASSLSPAPASAVIPNPVDAVKDLLGVPGDVASAFGADVLRDALAWLLGGLKATITLELVKFLVHVELAVGGSLARLTAPMIVIGGLFLVVGLITSIGDGYRDVVAGTDTAPRVMGQAIFRVIGLAILLGSWFWCVRLAVDVANGTSGYVLGDEAVGSALRRTFAAETLLSGSFPLLGLLTGIMLAFGMLALVVLKFVIAIAFAALYIGGPALIGIAALPRIGNLPLAIVARGLLTLTLIPLLWTVVFAGWAGVSAGMFDGATGDRGGAVEGLMGPGLFLAGLVVMLAATKKALAMATLGVALSVPGVGIARSVTRSVLASAVTRGVAGPASGGGASQDGGLGGDGERLPTSGSTDRGQRQPAPRPAAWGSARAEPPRSRTLRKLELGDPDDPHRAREPALARRAAAAAISLFGATRQGVFEQPGDVRADAWTDVSTAVSERRLVGEASAVEVAQAADALPQVDRSAFGMLARESLEQRAESSAEIFRANATRVVASRADQLDSRQREAGITLAAARPEVVNAALAPDYRAWGHGDDERSAESAYDTRLMDRQGGLERFRQETEGGQGGARKGHPDDEGLPF
jgi:hypothetical protein